MPRRPSRKHRGGDLTSMFEEAKNKIVGVVEEVKGALPGSAGPLVNTTSSQLGTAPEGAGRTLTGGRRRRRKTGNRRTKRRV